MNDLFVCLLGTVRAVRDGVVCDVPSRRQRALLAALAVRLGATVTVSELIDAVWPDDPPERARTTLQTYVSRLRALLGDDAIGHDGGGYRLHPGSSTDAVEVRRLLAESDAISAVDAQRAADLALEAVGRWSGSALGDLADDEWFAPTAVVLGELRNTAVDTAARALVAARRPAAAIELLEPFVLTEPFREPSQLLLIRALHHSGRNTEALRAADRYRARLRDETGLDPSAALDELERQVLAGDPVDDADRAPALVPARGLPRPTRLIGRDGDVERLSELLVSSRLVTVSGPGGIGKTRLAAEALQRLPARQTVVVVELAAVTDRSVAPSIAAALGHRAGAVDDDTVAELVGAQELLLVLDNCEHVIASTRPLVRTLLDRCGGLRVLLTSRLALGLVDETALVIEPLDTAGPVSPAAELFVDRLSRADPDTTVGVDDGAVADVCRRLDGVPLAIELAAGRAVGLGVDALAARLGGALDLVAATADPDTMRHTSLRSVVRWSFDLLQPHEQLVLASLSCFESVFDVAAAEALGAAVVDEPVAPLLGRLVDMSLVATSGAPGRYRLLEMIRQFASERLRATGRVHPVRRAHADWVAGSVALVAASMAGPTEATTTARLDAHRHDVRAAMRWCGDHGEIEPLTAIVASLAGPLLYRPDAELIDLVLGASGLAIVDDSDGGAAIFAAAARASFLAGDLTAVDALATRAIDAASDQPDGAAARRRADHARGVVRLYRGEFDAARACYRAVTDDRGASAVERLDSLGGLALAACYAGAWDDARAIVDEHAALAGTIESDTYLAFADYVRGEIAFADGDVDAASEHLAHAAERAWSVGATFVWGIASTVLAAVLVRHRPAEAAVHLPSLVERWRRTATWPQLWTTLRLVAELLAAHGIDDVAASVLVAADRDPAAPQLAGAEKARVAALRGELIGRLGRRTFDGIEAGALTLGRVAVADRAVAALGRLPRR